MAKPAEQPETYGLRGPTEGPSPVEPEEKGPSTAKSSVASVAKALRIVEALAEARDDLSVTELAGALHWHRSTVYRFLQSLIQSGWVRRGPSNDRYRLTFRIVNLANSVVNRLDIRQMARPHLVDLVEETGFDAHLAVMVEGEVVFLDRIDCGQATGSQFHIGRRAPAYATAVGKAMLTSLDGGQLIRLYGSGELRRFTPSTITSVDQLVRELSTIRAQGYAVDKGEHNEGVYCVAAAFRDHAGRFVGAVSASGDAQRFRKANISVLGAQIIATAQRISKSLGYHAAS